MKQILINDENLETRVAVVNDGKLSDYFIERKGEGHLVGSIYKGVIRNLEPSLQAAFVDIGEGKNAFLHYWDMLPASRDKLEREFGMDAGGAENGDSEKEVIPQEQDKGSKSSAASLRERIFRRVQNKNAKQRKRGGGRKKDEGNCSIEDIPTLFPVNSEVVVQVTKGSIGTKGPRVTTNLSIASRYLVLLPNSGYIGLSKRISDSEERSRLREILSRHPLPKNMGLVCRTVGAGKKAETFERDLAALVSSWQQAEDKIKSTPAPCCVYQEPTLVERCLRDYLNEHVDEVVTDSKEIYDLVTKMSRILSRHERVKVRLHKDPKPLFDRYRLREQIDNIFQRQVELPSGGSICIDETEALTAIDVNSGRNRDGKDHPETILRTNLEAVEEIARQLKIRNIGGLIVLDLIDMRSRKHIQQVFSALKEAMAEDRAKTKLCPISPLGLVEMTRQREHESLHDTIYTPCPYCKGRGSVKSATSVSVEIQRRLQSLLRGRKKRQIRVMVHPRILERLKNEDADLLHDMENEFGGELSFRADPDLHIEEFHLIDVASGSEL